MLLCLQELIKSWYCWVAATALVISYNSSTQHKGRPTLKLRSQTLIAHLFDRDGVFVSSDSIRNQSMRMRIVGKRDYVRLLPTNCLPLLVLQTTMPFRMIISDIPWNRGKCRNTLALHRTMRRLKLYCIALNLSTSWLRCEIILCAQPVLEIENKLTRVSGDESRTEIDIGRTTQLRENSWKAHQILPTSMWWAHMVRSKYIRIVVMA